MRKRKIIVIIVAFCLIALILIFVKPIEIRALLLAVTIFCAIIIANYGYQKKKM